MRKPNSPLIFGLCLALLLSLAGCGSGGDGTAAVEPTATPSVPDEVEKAEESRPDFSTKGMRIVLCTSPTSVDDRGHNAGSYEGILSFIISRGAIDSVTPIQETTGDPALATQAVRTLVDNYDVMVCVGPAFADLVTIAKNMPDKYFILVDADAEEAPDNLCSLAFAEHECAFLAGIAAALESRTGRVAVVNSVPSPVNTRYYYGFRSGVAYSNGNFGTTTEVIDLPEYTLITQDGTPLEGNFTYSCTNESLCYSLARDLMAQQCDVLLVAADAAGKGAYTAVKEHSDVWIIGTEADQFPQGETATGNVVLTSVTKNTALMVEQLLNDIVSGTFQGGIRPLGTRVDAIGYVSSPDHQQMSSETLERLAQCYPMLQDGTLVPRTGPQ